MLIKVLFIVSTLSSIEALKILAIFPYTGKSHHYVFEPLLQRLSDKGHELTVISHYPNPSKSRTDIRLVTDMSKSENTVDLIEFESIPKPLRFMQTVFENDYLYSFGIEMCENLLTNQGVKDLLLSSIDFDVALVEQFNSDCLLGLVHKLDVKSVIGITSDTVMPWHFDRLGMTSNPTFVPCHFLGYGTKPTFFQRINSMVVCGLASLGYDFMAQKPTEDLLRKHLDDEMPSMKELVKNVDLLLINSYFATHGGMLLPPNVKEVGGLHLKQNHNKLPEDIEKFISESRHGVIFFSLGSMVKSSSLSTEKLKAFQEAFAALPNRILWKWENDTMPDMPKNVLIKKWLPQFDILCHNNVKAFISHGGMLSTTEAAHCGVPTITIPLFGDQYANAAAVKDSGLGVVLHYQDMTKQTLLNALKTTLEPKMQNSAKKVAEIYNDRPLKPLDESVYWIEHVAKHGGAHLRSPSADIPLYQYQYWDIMLFLTGIIVLIVYINYKISECILKVLTKSPKGKRD